MPAPLSRPTSSVTRWLLVVVGCAVLETAQPMNASEAPPAGPPPAESAAAVGDRNVAAPPAPPPAPPPAAATGPAAGRRGDTLLLPGGAPTPDVAGGARGASGAIGASWLFVAFVGAAGAAYVWWRRLGAAAPRRPSTGIVIEETRPLGNRQFLVIANCDGRRFLLGVATGGIQMLAPLEPKEEDLDDLDNA